MPQFDSDPVFCRLLRDDGETDLPGFFEVELVNFSHSEQEYQTNTAILDTILYDTNGGAVRITDFAPRYQYAGRVFTPMMLARRIRPETGAPRIRIRLRPARDYGAKPCKTTHGSNHIRYICSDTTLRLTTDASLTHVLEENAFVLDGPLHLLLGPDETIPESCDDAYHTPLPRDARLLAVLVARAFDPVRMAGSRDSRSDHPEAVHVRRHGRRRGCTHHVDSGGGEQRAQLGLPILLAARQLFRRAGAEPAGHDRHDGTLPRLHHEHRRGGRRRGAQTAVWHQRPVRYRRADRRIAVRLPGHAAGSTRQPGIRTGAARRLWRGCTRGNAVFLR